MNRFSPETPLEMTLLTLKLIPDCEGTHQRCSLMHCNVVYLFVYLFQTDCYRSHEAMLTSGKYSGSVKGLERHVKIRMLIGGFLFTPGSVCSSGGREHAAERGLL